ncbi:MAG: 2-octaprenyl-6-methoxyphenyl hydroxylase [Pseudomonadales bacterium]|nr:2-octaprenyl-6-methoxyphenyl hydroxylase [Pseudomonadales bacterium]
MKNNVDVCIVGGGMVGATLACALAKNSDLSILLIEAFPLKKTDVVASGDYQSSYDARSTALSRGTAEIFHQLECWALMREQATPILDIHVSEKGGFGFSHLSAKKENVPALGYVVENAWLGRVLIGQLFQHSNIQILSPAKVASIDFQADCVSVTVEGEQYAGGITATLLIAADGQDSEVRRMLGIDVDITDYEQQAIIANVSPDCEHQGLANERFTANGPLALLPISDNRYSLVWSLAHDEAAETLALSDDDFLVKLQSQIGQRVGKMIKVGERFSYPLQLMRAKEQVRPRVVIVGNAAHSLHPVAGQGFNVAARDVAVLAAEIKGAFRRNQPIGDFSVLQQYWDKRRLDQEKTIQFSDKLLRLFDSESGLLRTARNIGLIGLDVWGPGKGVFAKHAMGANHYVSLL